MDDNYLVINPFYVECFWRNQNIFAFHILACLLYYSDVTSVSWHLKSLTNWLFIQQFGWWRWKKHQDPYYWHFVRVIHWWLVVSPHKRPIMQKVCPCHNIICRLWCQKQVSQAGISNYIPQFTMGCNYLSLPEIPASGNKVLIGCRY